MLALRGRNFSIKLELHENCLKLDDTLQALRNLDSHQPEPELKSKMIIENYPFLDLIAKFSFFSISYSVFYYFFPLLLRKISVKAENICASLSGYPLPLLSTPMFEMEGLVIIGHLGTPVRFQAYSRVCLSPHVFMNVEATDFIPIKIYCDIKCKLYGKESLISWGRCLDGVFDKLSQCAKRLSKKDPPSVIVHSFYLYLHFSSF